MKRFFAILVLCVLALLMAAPFLSAQSESLSQRFILVAEWGTATTVNDSIFQIDVTFPGDQLGAGYLPTQIQVGWLCLDATGRRYRITAINDAGFADADLNVLELADLDSEPTGVGIVYNPSAQDLIHTVMNGNTTISNTLMSRIFIHNMLVLDSLLVNAGSGVDSFYLDGDTLRLETTTDNFAVGIGSTGAVIDTFYRAGDSLYIVAGVDTFPASAIEPDSAVYATLTTLGDSMSIVRDSIDALRADIGTGGGGVTGTGTTNRLAKWSSSTALTDAGLLDNGTDISALLPFTFPSYTTAGLPTGSAGKMVFNTTVGAIGVHNGTGWNTLISGAGSSNQSAYFSSSNELASNSRHTIDPTTGAQTITFNNTAGSRDWILDATTPISSGGPFGFRYQNNNQILFGLLGGSRITFTGSGAQATLSGNWNFSPDSQYPSPNLAGTNTSSNDVRLRITRTGTGASQTISAFTQRLSVNGDAPSLLFGATNFTFSTKNAATVWNVVGDTTRLGISQSGDVWLGLVPIATATPSATARLQVIGRGINSQYPIISLESTGSANTRFQVLENGIIRLGGGLTASRPIGTNNDIWYNTTDSRIQIRRSGTWESVAVLGDISTDTNIANTDLTQTGARILNQSGHNLTFSGGDLITTGDTLDFSGVLFTSPSTSLNILNKTVGTSGILSPGGGFHTNLNGTITGTSGSTGHIVIGGTVTANSAGSVFNTNIGYVSNTSGEYASSFGYNADATTDRTLAIGYDALANEIGEISIGSARYNKIELRGDSATGRVVLPFYGVGNKEAGDLSKTLSPYVQAWATDGTELELLTTALPNIGNTDLTTNASLRTLTVANNSTLIIRGQGLNSAIRVSDGTAGEQVSLYSSNVVNVQSGDTLTVSTDDGNSLIMIPNEGITATTTNGWNLVLDDVNEVITSNFPEVVLGGGVRMVNGGLEATDISVADGLIRMYENSPGTNVINVVAPNTFSGDHVLTLPTTTGTLAVVGTYPRAEISATATRHYTLASAATNYTIDTLSSAFLTEFTYSAGVLTYTGTATRRFLINYSLSVATDDSVLLSAGIDKNGAGPLASTRQAASIGTTTGHVATANISGSGIVGLATSDTVKIVIQSDGAGAPIASVFFATLTIIPID